MFGIEILDVVIGLVFIYLLLSLLASIINEMITSVFSTRGRNLEKTIRWMLGNKEDSSSNKGLFDAFTGHPLYKKMKSPDKFLKLFSGKPSYLSSSRFSTIVTDILLEQRENEPDDLQAIRNALERYKQGLSESEEKGTSKTKKNGASGSVDSDTINILQTFLREAEGLGLQKFQADLEEWYDSVMDRAKGWYKRRVQLYVFAIGFLIAALFNADTFQIAKTLSIDPVARAAIVERARDFAENNPNAVDDATANAELDSLYARVDELIDEEIIAVNSVMGLGWPEREEMNIVRYIGYVLAHSWDHIAGWIVTAMAISLGAPFWFDLLNKVMKLRGTGTKIDGNHTNAVG